MGLAQGCLYTFFLLFMLSACTPKKEKPVTPPVSDLLQVPNYTSPSLSNNQIDAIAKDYADTPFKVLHFAEQRFDRGPALTLTFSAPINPKTPLHKYIQLIDANNQAVTGSWISNAQLNMAVFPFISPNTTYSAEVAEGLTAINGKVLSEPFSATLTTQKRQQGVRFKSRGAQLSTTLSDGLTVESINIDEVDIDFHRVDEANLHRFLDHYLGKSAYQLAKLQNYSELVFSARYELNRSENRRRDSLIHLKDIKVLQQPGVYIAVMKAAGSYPYEHQVTWFTVSDVGMQARTMKNGLLVFVNHVDSAEPAKGVSIRLYDKNGKMLSAQTTDKKGFVEFYHHVDNAIAAVATKNQHLSLVKLRSAAMDLTEFAVDGRAFKPLELFLYGPRDLYRPTETIFVNGLLRDYDGKHVKPQAAKVEIVRPDGRVHSSFTWRADNDSFYQHQFTLPANTLSGNWVFKVTLGNKSTFSYPFQVEDFLPERMKLNLSTAQTTLLSTQTPQLSIQGDYLYGTPAAGNRAEVNVTITPTRNISTVYKDFIFGTHRKNKINKPPSIEPIKLDEKGHFNLSLPNQWRRTQQPLRLVARTSLFELGGRPVTRSQNYLIWPQEHMVGIRPLWDNAIASPDSELNFELINIDRNDKLHSKNNVTATLIREDSKPYWQWDDGWSYQNQTKDLPVQTKVLSLSTRKASRITAPVQYGHYRLEITDQEQQLLASYRFFAGWRWDRQADGIMSRPDSVTLHWNKSSFNSGDNAQLSIESPYDGRAIITLEADGLLWHDSVEVINNKARLTIPVDKQWRRHDIYATANVIRAGKASTKHLPKRAFGILHLPLNRETRHLDIRIDTPEKILPDSELVANIKVNGEAQNNIKLTLAAVDSGVLSINNTPTPKPFDWFFAKRRYTTEIRDTWGLLIEQLSTTNARLRFGGDSDTELTRGGDKPLSDVQVVSLFSGKVELNEHGEGQVRFNVPYFNGELQLRALAFSHQAYGHQNKKVTVAAPLVSSISLPRFLGYGDESTSTIALRNTTDDSIQFTVALTASQALGGAVLNKSLKLAAQQKTLLKLPISGDIQFGQGEVKLVVSSDDEAISLNRSWTLGLRSPYAAQWRSFDGIIDKQNTWQLEEGFNQNFSADAQHLLLTASANLPINTSDHFKRLLDYPYGCLEQTTSRAWPLMIGDHKLLSSVSGDTSKDLLNNKNKIINQAIARISSMQRRDGSFGLWSNSSNENHWLSVYATDFLLRANERGFAVQKNTLKNAMQRLRQYLRSQRRLFSENSIYSQWPEHYNLSYRAYAAYVLASKHQARLSDLRLLYDTRANAAKSALPLAYLASALEQSGDTRRAKAAWQKAVNFADRKSGYAGDYGSDVRDLANTIALVMNSQIATLPSELVVKLRNALIERRWLSTQERFALFHLAQHFAQSDNETWQIELNKDSQTITQDVTGQWQTRFSGANIPHQLSITTQRDSAVFINAVAQGYPKQTPKPVSEGIQIARSYYKENGELADLTKVKSGDLVLVRLDMSSDADERIPEAMLIEMLPAGFELENQNLDSSVKMSSMKVENKTVEQWMRRTTINHQEYRDDRYVAAVPLWRRKSTLFYLVRAVTPGTYQVPPSQIEDMYRPYIRAIGEAPSALIVAPKS